MSFDVRMQRIAGSSILVLLGCSPNVVIDGAASGVGGGATTTASVGVGEGATGTSTNAGGFGGAGGIGGTSTATGGSTASSSVSSSTGVGGSSSSSSRSASSSTGSGGGVLCSPPNQPTLLAPPISISSESYQIALDDAFAYWADLAASNVSRVSLCTHEVTVLASNEVNAISVAVDAEHIVWGTASNNGKLRIAPIGGGPAKTLWHGGPIWSIALEGSRIYFIGWASNGVYAIDNDGSNLVKLFDGFTDRDLAIDDENVYFSDGQWLRAVPKGGGTSTQLAELDENREGTIAAGGGNVFTSIFTSPDHSLISVPRAGGAPSTLAVTVNPFGFVTTTPTLLLYTGEDGVFERPSTGGSPTLLSNDSHGGGIVAHGNGVAWMSYPAGLYWMALP